MFFSPPELLIVRTLADAALPAGQVLPAPSDETLRRLDTFFAEAPAAIGTAYRAMLWALELRATAGFGARFSSLPVAKRLNALHAWEALDATRLVVRGLLTPLKLVHFGDPAVFAALGCRYAVEPPATLEPQRWRAQVSDAARCSDGESLECDAVVVGTGAGGAPVAAALAERGHAVLLLEEGQYFTRQDFTGRPVDMMRKMYRKSGFTVALGNTVIPLPIGKGVGGTTLINSGTCLRAPETTLFQWRTEYGLSEFTADFLAPHYEQVERFLEVGPSSMAALGKPAELIARGCEALGYSHHPLARNAPACDGQGLCCFGCPTDAKRSTNVSWVPRALDAGAQLLTGFQVERVLTEGDRAVGVAGVARGAQGPVRLTVRAKLVVLACGSLLTPVLLLKNRLANRSGQVGRNLSIHPASSAIGLFSEPLQGWKTVPQGYAIDEFHDEGLLFEGAHAPLEITAAALTAHGPGYVALLEQYDRTLGFGFLVKDTSRGRVRVGAGGDPLITYWLNARDLKRLQRAFGILARVFFAGGAKEVYPSVAHFERLTSLADVERLEGAHLSARHMDLTAYHPLGTCRVGKDAATSVVDLDHQTHDVHHLYVCDGSAVPGSLGVNPQLTIMAMSLRAAEGMHRRLEQWR